jgi:hypothetical protein
VYPDDLRSGVFIRSCSRFATTSGIIHSLIQWKKQKKIAVEYDDNDDSCSWGAAAAAAAECKAIKGKTLSCSNTALPRPAIYEDHAAAVVDHHHHHHHNHHDVDQLLQLLHGSDPVRMELARLENELKGKTVVVTVV